MRILDKKINRSDLKNSQFVMDDEMVKGVVDVAKELLAIDAEMHADLEQFLLEKGSDQFDLWGINLYFDGDLVEFDSMINIRPAQGNRSRGVDDKDTQEKILKIVNQWIKND
ncbi:hypothetical protein IJG04_03465 [Candidatus Saccharibacteria bacterium]|nr:hypothetical protein [Candidatus Saccharibacteria bacterium]